MPNGAGSTAAVRRQDRRRCVRRKVLANGEMISVDLGPLESGLLLDICARGASVQGLKPLRPGVRISLKLRLPGSEVSVQPTYEVIWADRNGRIGLKFLYIAEREQRLLDEWAAAYFPNPEPEPAPEPPRPSDERSVADSTLAPTLTLEQELARVVEQASGYTCAEGGAIALREGQGIVCRASWGNAPEIGVLLNPDSGLSGECIRTGASVHCADALTDARVDTIAAHQLNLRSALIVPIKIDEAVQGIIEVLSSRPAAFTPVHLTSLERLAEIVGFLTGPPVAPPAESIKVAEPVAPEASASASRAEPEPVSGGELRAEVAPEPVPVADAEADTVNAASTDIAGIIQLIDPELRPVPLSVRERSAAHPETVEPETEPALEESAETAESPAATPPLPSLDNAPHRGLHLSILAAVILACGILVLAAWFLVPRWVSKRGPHTALPVAATPQRSPAISTSAPSSPAPLIQLPAGPPPTSRAAQPKHGRASTDPASDEAAPSDEDDDVTVVTWVNGRKLPANPAGRSDTNANVPATPVRVADADASPLRVTSQAMLDRIISRPTPEYPEEARRNHIEGVVTLKVIVGADGHVETATPISGPPILAVAAAKAVSQWRYHPYLRDGKPVRVETTVMVGFRRG